LRWGRLGALGLLPGEVGSALQSPQGLHGSVPRAGECPVTAHAATLQLSIAPAAILVSLPHAFTPSLQVQNSPIALGLAACGLVDIAVGLALPPGRHGTGLAVTAAIPLSRLTDTAGSWGEEDLESGEDDEDGPDGSENLRRPCCRSSSHSLLRPALPHSKFRGVRE